MVGAELPFAGHPTIGTLWYCANHYLPKEVLRQETGDRWIPITLNAKAGKIEAGYNPRTGFAKASIPQDVHIHTETLTQTSLLSSQPALRQFAGQIQERLPLVSIVKGMTFALIELPSVETLGSVHLPQAHPDVALDEGWMPSFVGTFYFCRIRNASAPRHTEKLRVRMLQENIEDPATGSGSAALGSYLALQRKEAGEFRFEITQGIERGQKSEIVVTVTVIEEGKVDKVVLEGTAVQVMKGKLEV
ncbi:Diaminopimelate epimerase-like protein [Eremomyces bilateralis CBS 781.70]|uniref:Diaminopimelate epimerase-like protein n=1 Tax=Eremomyces bilateralis CBS 781.70 TaxID=1392243 RepID=A0A6G1FYV6_9PEZI|nr:Diaminopimelate epimerase-like protein [Eremomyces bilateralis CBS 781.70]KAF1810902.1 Diaminopimelate epimerase-like protein [Eremomyces bilateralis CBS 781.70]